MQRSLTTRELQTVFTKLTSTSPPASPTADYVELEAQDNLLDAEDVMTSPQTGRKSKNLRTPNQTVDGYNSDSDLRNRTSAGEDHGLHLVDAFSQRKIPVPPPAKYLGRCDEETRKSAAAKYKIQQGDESSPPLTGISSWAALYAPSSPSTCGSSSSSSSNSRPISPLSLDGMTVTVTKSNR